MFRETGTKHGYLTKQGHVMKNWRRRYFVLTSKAFSYYVDESMKRHKGSVNIINAQIADSDIKSNCFAIADGSGKKFFVQAENDKEKSEWYAILEYVLSIQTNQ
jgi:hypothetical protein